MTEKPFTLESVGKNWIALVAILSAAATVLLSPFVLDVDVGAYVALVAFAFAGGWYVWRVWSIGRTIKVLLTVAIVGVTVGWGYLLQWAAQPHFAITAFDTLERDANAYEVTDQLICNQNDLGVHGVGITFTVEIRPIYSGERRFGQVIALISGDSDKPPLEIPVWSDFSSDSGTKQIELTLPELLNTSGLQKNSEQSANPFRSGGLYFQQAGLTVQIAQEAKKGRPWSSETVMVRNAPWEQRSQVVERNGDRQADVYVRNLGGAGWFNVRYRLAFLEPDMDVGNTDPTVSGVATQATWNSSGGLRYLEQGEFLTDTTTLPDQLAQGRYLLEVYTVKKQNYVQFADPSATWEDLNSLDSPWWFGQSPPDIHLVLVADSEFALDPIVEAEYERLRDAGIVDLGLPLSPVEEVTSAAGTVGFRQRFEEGEVYVHGDQAYAIYGSVLDHYLERGGIENEFLSFPISPIQTVVSSSDTEGAMMEFEGTGGSQPTTMIFAWERGVAEVQGWIRQVYSDKCGGHAGWLGFPLADMEYVGEGSTIQTFEHGYIVYYYPDVNGEPDYGRQPEAYPYLGGPGDLFDVHAELDWQNTGVEVQPGDRVSIVQVGGSWTNGGASVEWFDANGNMSHELQENALLPSARIGALIGKVGEGGQPFLVGRWSFPTISEAGTLHLAMNDNSCDSNVGLITVQIIVGQ